MSVAPAIPVIDGASLAMRAPSLETIGMTKVFGQLVALDDVSIKVEPGTVHALLGENGAGKSTLVKCIMGFYSQDKGQVLLDGQEVPIRNPRDARALGIGMVYQHFTLVPSLTGAENLVISRADAPAVIDWKKEMASLNSFLDRMPFRVPLDLPVSAMAAGEKQKLEILKLLYLDQRLLILDEPTSVLTPDEADEMLGLLRGMTQRKEITVIMITHKFREVLSFCDSVTVLRRGRNVGGGEVKDLTTEVMARMMIGDTQIRDRAVRSGKSAGDTALELVALYADDDEGLRALDQVNLKVRSGEIVGVAGVSGNGQSELVEVLAGQRPLTDGRIVIKQHPFEPDRDSFYRLKIFGLPEEPLKNAAVPRMTVAENMAFRTFDRPPAAKLGWWCRRDRCARRRASSSPVIASRRHRRKRRFRISPAVTYNAPCWRANSPAKSMSLSSPIRVSVSILRQLWKYAPKSWSSGTAAPPCCSFRRILTRSSNSPTESP
jgi:general nucleoside transport system ATP-binding protein